MLHAGSIFSGKETILELNWIINHHLPSSSRKSWQLLSSCLFSALLNVSLNVLSNSLILKGTTLPQQFVLVVHLPRTMHWGVQWKERCVLLKNTSFVYWNVRQHTIVHIRKVHSTNWVTVQRQSHAQCKGIHIHSTMPLQYKGSHIHSANADTSIVPRQSVQRQSKPQYKGSHCTKIVIVQRKSH